jgi:hypothetical protein
MKFWSRGAKTPLSVGHMVVICAPTSGGKSTVAERLLRDRELRQRLGLEDAGWELVKADELLEGLGGSRPHLIVMYNLLRRLNKDIDPRAEDPIPALLAAAERLTLITLIPTPERLRAQFQRSEMPDPDRRYSAKIRRLRDAYQDDRFLGSWYREWFDRAESIGPGRSRHWIMTFASDDGEIRDASGWRELVAERFGAT